METLTTWGQRLQKTRGWLDSFIEAEAAHIEDFEIITHPEEDTTSNYGVESVSSYCSQGEGHDLTTNLANDYPEQHNPVCPGDCNGECPACKEARLIREGPLYCWICHGDCYNRRSKVHPDDIPDVKTAPWMGHEEAISYEIAGRDATCTFRDFRSGSKARGRRRRENEKYFGYRAVKPGWLGGQFYNLRGERPFGDCVLMHDAPVQTMTKQQMFHEAQAYPRPPTYHRRRMEKDYYPWKVRKGWRHAAERKHHRLRLDVELGLCNEEASFLQRDPDMWTSDGWPWGPDSCADCDDWQEDNGLYSGDDCEYGRGRCDSSCEAVCATCASYARHMNSDMESDEVEVPGLEDDDHDDVGHEQGLCDG